MEPSNLIPIGAVEFSLVEVETWTLDKASVIWLVRKVMMELVCDGGLPELVIMPVSVIAEGHGSNRQN